MTTGRINQVTIVRRGRPPPLLRGGELVTGGGARGLNLGRPAPWGDAGKRRCRPRRHPLSPSLFPRLLSAGTRPRSGGRVPPRPPRRSPRPGGSAVQRPRRVGVS